MSPESAVERTGDSSGMSTTLDEKMTTPPRWVIRTFWAVHRTMVGLTGGRLGLWRPREGKRFGVMRLRTIGRRSGNERSVIVGYFEDGPNLVTLAMNGWADTPPAWWLNLQAEPRASVTLATGTRPFYARRADGDERGRLWARFDEFPGWGENLDVRTSQRATDTPIVVFEPGGSDADTGQSGDPESRKAVKP